MAAPTKRTFEFSANRRRLMSAMLRADGLEVSERVRIPRRAAAESYPLSYAQQRLWFLDQLVPGHAFYNCAAAMRLQFAIIPEVLERSLNEIVARHEALRTTFQSVDGKPVQVIAPILRLPLPIIDLRDLPPFEREQEAMRLATEESRKPFDLSAGPLVRTTIVQLGDNDHLFLLTVHHIVSDGWSMGIFFNELKELYGAFFVGRASPLPELRIQYADFAVWQRGFLENGPLEEQLVYWKQKLADAPVLQLPVDRPREAMRSFAGTRQYRTIPADLLASLKRLTQRENVTLFMVLLAGLLALLHRYTRQTDIVVGGPIANRNHLDVEGLIGFFVNSVVLRTDVSGDPTFLELLHRARDTSLDAYAHQDVPFETLVDVLHEERNMWRNPLYQVSLQYFSIAESLKTAPQLEVEKGTAAIDIAIDVMESPDGLVIRTEYSTELFDAATITRMIAHLETVLRGAAEDPDRRISELPLLDEDERRRIVVEWNQTQAERPADARLHALFEAQAARTPDATAISFRDESLSVRRARRAGKSSGGMSAVAGSRAGHAGGDLDRTFPRSGGRVGRRAQGRRCLRADRSRLSQGSGVLHAARLERRRRAHDRRLARRRRPRLHTSHRRGSRAARDQQGGRQRVRGRRRRREPGLCHLHVRFDRPTQRCHGRAPEHLQSALVDAERLSSWRVGSCSAEILSELRRGGAGDFWHVDGRRTVDCG